MIERDIQAAFNECIDRITSGESIQQCLEDFPQFANDLRPMLEAGNVIRRSLPFDAEVLAAQERVRFQVQRAAYELPLRSGRRGLPLRAFASLVALLLVAFVSTGLLAQASLPGDTLYGTKRLTERLINGVAGGGQPVEEQFASRRIDEINALLGLNRVETVDFRGDVESIDGLNWQVGSLALAITPETSGDDGIIVGDRVDVVAYTTPSSQLVAQVIDLVERNQELPPPSATPQATLTVTVTASPTETASPSETATATPSPDPTSTGTPSPTTTVTSTATTVVTATDTDNQPAAAATSTLPVADITDLDALSGCQPPATWVTYTIRPGDTLSTLAGATGTTIDDVMSVNCLDDARFIVIGQIIYLPRQPQIAPPGPSGGGNTGGSSGGGGNSGGNDNDDDGGDDDD